jgi:hypothetical protein
MVDRQSEEVGRREREYRRGSVGGVDLKGSGERCVGCLGRLFGRRCRDDKSKVAGRFWAAI